MSQEHDQSLRALEHEAAGLRSERDRYRAAMQDTLEQVDWCIGYFTARRMPGLAQRLSANRGHIRTDLLGRAEQPLPKPPQPSSGRR